MNSHPLLGLQVHAAQQVGEARVGAERIEDWVNLNTHGQRAVLEIRPRCLPVSLGDELHALPTPPRGSDQISPPS